MKKRTIDGSAFKKMIIKGANKLDDNKELLNSLNVFPVPDGDTGTNMSLTVLSAAKEVEKSKDNTITGISKLASNGSLRGARGNSGVIVSQLYRGFATAFKGKDVATIEDIANGFVKAKETAYKAVIKPKEGTILTVATALADKAMEIKDEVTDVDEMFTKLIKHGNIVLDKTMDMLEVLREANVVDSGAKGLMTIVEGWGESLRTGEEVTINEYKASREEVDVDIFSGEIDIEFAYCTEFFIVLEEENDEIEDKLKGSIGKLGDSLVVVADEKIVKIHVHTNNPGKALEEAVKYGKVDSIKIENMEIQNEKLQNARKANKPKKPVGIVTVAQGDGIYRMFDDLGVDEIIRGGQSMNPSTEEILKSIEKVNSDNVIMLPNNKNVFLACEQAKELAKSKKIHIIYTKTVQEGISALINYIPSEDVKNVVESLEEGYAEVKSLEVTYAVRDITTDIEIKKGDYLYISDGNIEFSNKDLEEGVIQLIESKIEEDSIITMYYGEEVKKEDAEKIAKQLSEKHKECEFDVYEGRQPLYYYLISIE